MLKNFVETTQNMDQIKKLVHVESAQWVVCTEKTRAMNSFVWKNEEVIESSDHVIKHVIGYSNWLP